MKLILFAESSDFNLQPVTDHLYSIFNPILNVVLSIVALVAIAYLIKFGLKLIRTSKPEEKSQALKNILWVFAGLIVCAVAFTLINIFMPAIGIQTPSSN